MAKFCGNCGSPLYETAIFCGACGTKVPQAAAPPALSPQPDPPVWSTVPAPAAAVPAPASPDPTAWQPVSPAASSSAPATPPASQSDPAGWSPVSVPQTPPPPANPAPADWQLVSSTPPPQPPYAGTAGTWQQPPSAVPPPQPYTASPAPYTPAAAYPAKKSNTLLKVVIAIIVIIFIGAGLALAGLYYAAQKISHKVHEATSQALSNNSPFASNSSGLVSLLGNSLKGDANGNGFKGDPCRFLSKQDVSHAVGVTVIRTEVKEASCSYIAKGDPASVTAKHAAAMLGNMGADAETQKAVEKFAGAIFAQQQATDKDLSAEAATGEVPVLVVTYTYGNAITEMKMNRGAFQHAAGGNPFSQERASPANTGSGDLAGIGDEAYVAGGSMMLVRKGNTIARFMYVSCPCNTTNIEPLARSVAARL